MPDLNHLQSTATVALLPGSHFRWIPSVRAGKFFSPAV